MHISNDRIAVMLKKVAVLREQLGALCLAKQEPALRVMDLHFVVEQVYGLKIEMIEVDFAAVYLRGKVERYANNTARVLVRSGVADTDKRLATVKELCHLALDEKEDWSTDGCIMVDALIDESRAYLKGKGIEAPTSPLQSEALALIAAGELMYPSEYRAADAEKLAKNETTISAIALQHDVPPFVIEHALENESILSPLRESSGTRLEIAAE